MRGFAVATLLTAAFALGGCGGVKVRATSAVPVPLVDELPLKAGVYYSPEFRNYVAREERWGTKWEITLGPAHVVQIDRLAKAMFASVTSVADVAKPPQPALDLIVEPHFEEYSFVTPRDAGAELFAVTIKYRVNVYDGAGHLVDSLVFTGYGNAAAGGLSSTTPLAVATQKAMRDAGAKFATEFPEQPVVQKLARHEAVEPLPTGNAVAATPGGPIGEVTPPAGAPPAPKPAPPATAGAPAAAPATTPAAAPGTATTPPAAPSAGSQPPADPTTGPPAASPPAPTTGPPGPPPPPADAPGATSPAGGATAPAELPPAPAAPAEPAHPTPDPPPSDPAQVGFSRLNVPVSSS
jgi:hypothetical protein